LQNTYIRVHKCNGSPYDCTVRLFDVQKLKKWVSEARSQQSVSLY